MMKLYDNCSLSSRSYRHFASVFVGCCLSGGSVAAAQEENPAQLEAFYTEYSRLALDSLQSGADAKPYLVAMWGKTTRNVDANHWYIDSVEQVLPYVEDLDLESRLKVQQAEAAHRLRENALADQILSEVIGANPDPATHWGRVSRYQKALHHFTLYDFDPAEEMLETLWPYRDAYETQHQHVVGVQLVETHNQLGNWGRVIEIAPEVIANVTDETKFPLSTASHLARAYIETGQHALAVQTYEQLIEGAAKSSDKLLTSDRYPYNRHTLQRNLELAKLRLESQRHEMSGPGEVLVRNIQSELANNYEDEPPDDEDGQVVAGSLNNPDDPDLPAVDTSRVPSTANAIAAKSDESFAPILGAAIAFAAAFIAVAALMLARKREASKSALR